MDDKLLKAASSLGSPTILLVGDFMLDGYIYADASRISPEAPVPVLKVVRKEFKCGGAGSVAADIIALGGRVICVGCVGQDEAGEQIIGKLAFLGADVSGIIKIAGRPTTVKQRFIGLAQHRHRQQLMRVDEETDVPLGEEQYQNLLGLFEKHLSSAKAVCIQDYNKGMLEEGFCRKLIEKSRSAGKKILVDPAAIKDYSKYCGATLITPNRSETARATGIEIDSQGTASRAAQKLQQTLNLEAAVITLDRDGAWLKTKDIDQIVPVRPKDVYDVTGAGDVVLATLAVARASGLDWLTSVELANIAGGIEVEKFGVATVGIDEIINSIIGPARKIQIAETLAVELETLRRQGKKIVFTNGCFDVLHRGHTEYLNFCKKHGDVLVVAINTDESVRKIKGPQRPVNNQHDRAVVLASLQCVDYVTFFADPDPLNIIMRIRPDVLVKGEDWKDKGVVGREFVESVGGKVILAPLVDGKSSTDTIEKIKNSIRSESKVQHGA